MWFRGISFCFPEMQTVNLVAAFAPTMRLGGGRFRGVMPRRFSRPAGAPVARPTYSAVARADRAEAFTPHPPPPTAPRIANVHETEDGLAVRWRGADETSFFHFDWLHRFRMRLLVFSTAVACTPWWKLVYGLGLRRLRCIQSQVSA